MTIEHSLHGSCLCGQIRYRVTNIGHQMAHCHCEDCRKFHGAAFSSFAEAHIENFQWLSGEPLLKAFVAPNGSTRQFCKACGSSLTFQARLSKELIEFSLATLDDLPRSTETSLQPDAHIFIDSKVIWYTPDDQLPKWPKHRGAE